MLLLVLFKLGINISATIVIWVQLVQKFIYKNIWDHYLTQDYATEKKSHDGKEKQSEFNYMGHFRCIFSICYCFEQNLYCSLRQHVD